MNNKDKDLTEQEQAFIDFLFDGDNVRHPNEAKILAGYPADYPYLTIVRKCSEIILERQDDYLTTITPKAIKGLIDIMDEPNEPGNVIKMKAITELLDRGGVVKKDKKEVQAVAPSHIFILPEKKPIEED